MASQLFNKQQKQLIQLVPISQSNLGDKMVRSIRSLFGHRQSSSPSLTVQTFGFHPHQKKRKHRTRCRSTKIFFATWRWPTMKHERNIWISCRSRSHPRCVRPFQESWISWRPRLHWKRFPPARGMDSRFRQLTSTPLQECRRPWGSNPVRSEKELYAHAKKEFDRLTQYFYESDREKCTSAIASPLVIAPKATEPFIRICGDYREVNEFITIPKHPIPIVQHELTKAAQFKVFVDLDMTNSFHQIPLSEATSNLLSVQTPWGLVRPKFLPEGVGPASGILQSIVKDIFNFEDFPDWTIVIFDNFLVLADDYDDAANKLERVIARCHEFGVILKIKKSFIGHSKVTFFGYEVSEGQWKLSESRKESIEALPFPKSKKEMQSFLGAALFFHNHIPDYSQWSAKLYLEAAQPSGTVGNAGLHHVVSRSRPQPTWRACHKRTPLHRQLHGSVGARYVLARRRSPAAHHDEEGRTWCSTSFLPQDAKIASPRLQFAHISRRESESQDVWYSAWYYHHQRE